jgi:hypothetical protein
MLKAAVVAGLKYPPVLVVLIQSPQYLCSRRTRRRISARLSAGSLIGMCRRGDQRRSGGWPLLRRPPYERGASHQVL